jgi:hypothetical protein
MQLGTSLSGAATEVRWRGNPSGRTPVGLFKKDAQIFLGGFQGAFVGATPQDADEAGTCHTVERGLSDAGRTMAAIQGSGEIPEN